MYVLTFEKYLFKCYTNPKIIDFWHFFLKNILNGINNMPKWRFFCFFAKKRMTFWLKYLLICVLFVGRTKTLILFLFAKKIITYLFLSIFLVYFFLFNFNKISKAISWHWSWYCRTDRGLSVFEYSQLLAQQGIQSALLDWFEVRRGCWQASRMS